MHQKDVFDLQGNGVGSDPKSWLSGGEDQHQDQEQHHISSSSNGNGNGNGNNGTDSNSSSSFDKVLYKDLVEMFPLIECLVEDRRANPSYSRRASLVHTKTPARAPKKVGELKGKKAAQSIPSKKRADVDEYSIFTARPSVVEKDGEASIALQEQVKSLQKKLLEKDELLRLAETSQNQMTKLNAEVNELKRHISEKDSLMKSIHMQFNDLKIKLADKQAALEKSQWEAATSNRKVEELQDNINSMQGEVSSFMLLLEGLADNDSTVPSGDYDISPYEFDHLPFIDDIDEIDLQQMEEAREAYIAALAIARENQDEESLANASEARLRLQSFVLGPKDSNSNSNGASHSFQGFNPPAEMFAH